MERNYSYQRHTKRVQQEFSPFVDEYFLNGKGFLEVKPIQRNQDEFIQSQEYVKLDEIYDTISSYSYFNRMADDVVDGLIEERERSYSELDLLMECDELFDKYKAELGTDKTLTRAEVYGLIKSKAETAISNINKYKEEKQREKEIQVEKKGEQEELHANSTQGAQ